MIYIIDLFCGAGGTTTGINQCRILRKQSTKVIACINHDENAILSHAANHPECLHFTEDIRTFDISKLFPLLQEIRINDEHAIICLWASLECTNFSIAKGGQPRDADSRTLAEDLYRYIEQIHPEYIFIENVKEFMSWGPLDTNGRPISRENGTDYLKWKKHVCSYNYKYDKKLINAADLGAYTSRLRYFGAFARPHLPIVWPEQTHTKKPGSSPLFKGLRKWKAVREVLDLFDKGISIFERKKPLSEKTLARIYAGLLKFVAGGKEAFLVKYNSMNQKGQYDAPDMNTVAPTIPCRNMLYLCHAEFITKYYSGKPDGKNIPVDGPAGTITCIDSQALVSAQFLSSYYSNGHTNQSVNGPAGSVTTKDRASLISPQFIMRDFKTDSNKSIDEPAGTLLPVPKQHLVTTEQFLVNYHHSSKVDSLNAPNPTVTCKDKFSIATVESYLLNPAWGGNNGSVDQPCPVIVARQDKAPLYMVTTEAGEFAIPIYDDDSPYTKLIKEFMVMYGIVDIKMRMLKINELLLIQGFPKSYKLIGTQTEQKKYIGNSVHPLVARKWFRALSKELYNQKLIKLAA